MALPPGFISMMRGLLGEETDDFLRAMENPPAVSIRFNSRKPGAEFPGGKPVKWCETGYYLPERPVFTLNPLLHAGAFYVQDASSMIYREVTSRILRRLKEESSMEKSPKLDVIDMCAAPGGKTTAIIDTLPDGSLITANEFVASRVGPLRENLTKWGYPGTTVTNCDTSVFAHNGNSYDLVAVDAPCSGEGMMRKDETARRQWSESLVADCSALQRKILTNAAECVKPGGFLIYSTCTFNRFENEENAEFIRASLGLESFNPGFPENWDIPGGIDTDLPVFRFMPHKTEGEGLFLAVFRKPGEWQPSHLAKTGFERKASQSPLGGKGKGNHAGKQKHDECPPIEEVLSVDFDRGKWPEAELTEKEAISYLRREAIKLPPDTPRGLVVITHKGLPLGMAKNIGTRANNLYPKGWRILMDNRIIE